MPVTKVWVGNIEVPMTRTEAQNNSGWVSVGNKMIFKGLGKKKNTYSASCQSLAEGDLCDAYRRPTGNVEASYCDGNNLCGRGYVSIEVTDSNTVRVEE